MHVFFSASCFPDRLQPPAYDMTMSFLRARAASFIRGNIAPVTTDCHLLKAGEGFIDLIIAWFLDLSLMALCRAAMPFTPDFHVSWECYHSAHFHRTIQHICFSFLWFIHMVGLQSPKMPYFVFSWRSVSRHSDCFIDGVPFIQLLLTSLTAAAILYCSLHLSSGIS